MAKQKNAEIDEDIIRGMVSGDIPRLKVKPGEMVRPIEPDTVSEIESGTDDAGESSATETEPPTDIPASKARRKREPKDYTATFLKKREPVQKRQTYISMALFAKLTDILAVIAPDTTVPTFLDNVLTHHLEQFRDEINELYTDKFKKPL